MPFRFIRNLKEDRACPHLIRTPPFIRTAGSGPTARHETAAVLTLSGRGNAVAPTPAGLRDA
ncbi:hypothetical protein BCEP4_1040007 [Burkholderia cepacia]|nr:hypothetical protein BCEP4_1040007 [Burkholderia cepacia]